MAARVVLVTGAARHLGGRLIRRLQRHRQVARVIGVDSTDPAVGLGQADFVRSDIRHPVVTKILATAGVDTVVHLAFGAAALESAGRTAMKEINLIGTMQLLAACQQTPTVSRLVVTSTAAVYGSSPQAPAVFTEDVEPGAVPPTGYAKDAVEVEGYVRGFGRRRPDVCLTVLRFVDLVGPRVDTPLTRYFALPVVPTVLGFDPRLQFVHEDDGVEILLRAAVADRPGIVNVAGDGVLLLSQAIRRAGRPTVAVPGPAVGVVTGLLRSVGLVDTSADHVPFLGHGRVVDTAELHRRFDYRPAYSTATAFADYVQARKLRPLITAEQAARVEQHLLKLVTSVSGRPGG